MTHRDGTLEARQTIYREAVELIEREFGRELTLEGVARQLCTSRRQLQRTFAEIGGTTFRAEIARVRMARARALLAGDALQVRDVAETVGYQQPAQFAKSFRRHHGQSPTRFRREQRGMVAA